MWIITFEWYGSVMQMVCEGSRASACRCVTEQYSGADILSRCRLC